MIAALASFAGSTKSYLKAQLRLHRAIAPFDEAQKFFERRYLATLLAVTRGDVVAAVRISRLNWQELQDLFALHGLNPTDYKTQFSTSWTTVNLD
jgi:hypothetical protein